MNSILTFAVLNGLRCAECGLIRELGVRPLVVEKTMTGPEIAKAALLIVDMQNDFVHPEGGFAHFAREAPEAKIDMPFLTGTVPHVKRLADAFRAAGRPVVYIAHMVKPDYS